MTERKKSEMEKEKVDNLLKEVLSDAAATRPNILQEDISEIEQIEKSVSELTEKQEQLVKEAQEIDEITRKKVELQKKRKARKELR